MRFQSLIVLASAAVTIADHGGHNNDGNVCHTCEFVDEVIQLCANGGGDPLLQLGCVCTNGTPLVADLFASCATCLRELPDKSETTQEQVKLVEDVMDTCNWPKEKVAASKSSLLQSVTVNTSRPTNVSQLPKTFSPTRALPALTTRPTGTVTAISSARPSATVSPGKANAANLAGLGAAVFLGAAAML